MTTDPPGAALDARSPAGRLAENLVHFADILHRAGVPVGPGAVVEAARALAVAGIGTREDLYWTLHAVLVKRHEHSVLFEQAFALFFRRRAFRDKLIAAMSPVAAPRRRDEPPRPGETRLAQAMATRLQAAQPQRQEVEIEARLQVSERELLQKKDFAQMTAAEIAEARRLVSELRLPEEMLRTRRLVPAPRGGAVDPRRSFRRTLRSGGDAIALAFRAPAERYAPIVALCDISGSMAPYTRVFLQFLHAVTDRRRRVHTFLFGTRLTNITRELKSRDVDEALARCSTAVQDWSGGTRIAASLEAFNRLWSRRVLGGGAIVLLFTDGLEREPGRLAFEMDRLHRSCRRLIWLNPLLRYDGFEAKAQGIRAMLPHVDEFRPVHNLESLQSLCRALGQARAGSSDPRRWLAAVV